MPAPSDRAWQRDPDPVIAHIEDDLTALGVSYLYHVHLDVHRALHLPALPEADLRAAYRTDALPGVFAKASLYGAAELLGRVRHGTAAHARDLRAVVQAVTDRWYALRLLPTRAAQLAVKATLTGLLRASGAPPEGLFPTSLDAATAGVVDAGRSFIVEHAREHAAELMDGLRDRTRHAVTLELLDAQVERRTPQQTAQRLLDQFATLNRDWRRVAITEAATHRAAGYLLGVPDGSAVEWVAAQGCCAHCAGHHGQRFTVRHAPGDGETEVWPGKSNKFRAFAPRTAGGEARGPDARAWACIPLHPHCRCRWVRVLAAPAGTSPRLEAYLSALAAL